MGENDIPRRLKRFQRKEEKGEEISDAALDAAQEFVALQKDRAESMGDAIFSQAKDPKEKAKTLAMEEVKRFKKAHNRLPKKEEYEQISEAIYSQLKGEQEKEKRIQRELKKELQREKKGRGKREALGKKEAGAGPWEEPSTSSTNIAAAVKKLKLDVKDLFAEEGKAPTKAKAEKESDLGELSDFGLDSGEELSMKDMGEEKEETAGCPNCNAVGEEIIFCPGCGKAYCRKCAGRSETLPNGKTKYYCPKCGKGIEK